MNANEFADAIDEMIQARIELYDLRSDPRRNAGVYANYHRDQKEATERLETAKAKVKNLIEREYKRLAPAVGW